MNGEKPKKAADLPFRPGVGAMLFNGEGEVFVGRRFGPRGAYVAAPGAPTSGKCRKAASMTGKPRPWR